jgi:hypothetical protein
MIRARRNVLETILVLLLANAAAAQAPRDFAPPSVGSGPETYGTSAMAVQTIHGFAFRAFESGLQYDDCCYHWYGGGFGASLSLPAGAVIDHIDLEACDAEVQLVMDVTAQLVICASNGVCTGDPNAAFTVGAPGCVRVASSPIGVVVDNDANSYLIQVNAASPLTKFRAVRVYYRLQVSPAPGTATFTDVPVGHPFHRFVEALAASGVTAGCGGGLYCVDNPISRGEMAVFLSVALGLHFAP